jgi:hypothetical protein
MAKPHTLVNAINHILNYCVKDVKIHQVEWNCSYASFWFYKRWKMFQCIEFYKRQSQEMVDYSFGCCHLNVCSKVYILENFYYDWTIEEWKFMSIVYMQLMYNFDIGKHCFYFVDGQWVCSISFFLKFFWFVIWCNFLRFLFQLWKWLNLLCCNLCHDELLGLGHNFNLWWVLFMWLWSLCLQSYSIL